MFPFLKNDQEEWKMNAFKALIPINSMMCTDETIFFFLKTKN